MCMKRIIHPGNYYRELVKVYMITIISVFFVFASIECFNNIINKTTNGLLSVKSAIISLLFYFLIQICMYVINVAYSYVVNGVKKNLQTALRNQCLGLLLEKTSFEKFKKIGKEKLVSIFVNDLSEYGKLYYASIIGLINNNMRLIVLVGILFYYHYILGIIIIIAVAILTIFTKYTNDKIEKYVSEKAMEKENLINRYNNIIEGWMDYRIFQKEGFMEQKLFSTVQKYENVSLKYEQKSNLISTLNSFLKILNFSALISIEIYLYLKGYIDIGNIVISISIIGLIEDEIDSIIENNQMLVASKPYENRMSCLLPTGDVITDDKIPEDWKSINLKNITFSYKDNLPVLKAFNQNFERGKKYAIIGKSGSGKSTLIKIMLGIIKNYKGKICIDNKELPLGSETLLILSSYLEQDIYLFEDTIDNNIFFSDKNKKERMKNHVFFDLIKKYIPDFSYEVKENGKNLSGGQKQLIGIARAIANDKKILIFDESFSAMNENLFEEIEAVIKEIEDITYIVITHKTIKKEQYDVIINMEV